MKVIMYGSDLCEDTIAALEELKTAADIELDFRNITKSLDALKEFLSIRDKDELYVTVKKNGGIGIPFFIPEDGKKTFEVKDFLSR